MSEPVRRVAAVHARRELVEDTAEELELAGALRSQHSREELHILAAQHAWSDGADAERMRRAIWRALTKRFGHGVRIGRGVIARHPETFEIGDGVFVGDMTVLHGRHDGRCVIGSRTWIGPQSYFDARDLVIEEAVGWGPGARVLGSEHTGEPVDVPVIETDLVIAPVRIGAWADIGVNAVILPGVTVGRGAIVGAGAVVTRDIEPFSVSTGVPARFLRWRAGYEPSAAAT